MTMLKIEPFSGISGDMFLAAAARLAGAEEAVADLPAQLGLDDAAIRFRTVSRGGIACCRADVRPGTTPPPRRHLADILALIAGASLDAPVRQRATDIFRLLADAEAAVHGVNAEQVHFHEVGAVDAILDIVGAAWLLERLAVHATVCTPICTGSGTTVCAHGVLPVPAPATARLLQGMPTFPGQHACEMTTPTGAAVLRHLQPAFELPPLVCDRSAYGAGGRDLADPNCLRLSLCRPPSGGTAVIEAEDLLLLQTNIDDAGGELLGADLLETLLAQGALDAFVTPIIMKKGRPGQKLEVLCRRHDGALLSDCILEHTPSLGVRILPLRRRTLPRTLTTVTTRFGDVGVKQTTSPGGRIRAIPEYEDCRETAARHHVSVGEVYRCALAAAAGDAAPPR